MINTAISYASASDLFDVLDLDGVLPAETDLCLEVLHIDRTLAIWRRGALVFTSDALANDLPYTRLTGPVRVTVGVGRDAKYRLAITIEGGVM